MVQFGGQFRAGCAGADDGDVELARNNGRLLALCAHAGSDQPTVEACGLLGGSGTANSLALGVPKSLVTLPTAIISVS